VISLFQALDLMGWRADDGGRVVLLARLAPPDRSGCAERRLGASWACRQVLAERSGAMLVTATDGNHGRAVARMAAHFGVEATVFVPAVMHRDTADTAACLLASLTAGRPGRCRPVRPSSYS
jgi:hypothetical protein